MKFKTSVYALKPAWWSCHLNHSVFQINMATNNVGRLIQTCTGLHSSFSVVGWNNHHGDWGRQIPQKINKQFITKCLEAFLYLSLKKYSSKDLDMKQAEQSKAIIDKIQSINTRWSIFKKFLTSPFSNIKSKKSTNGENGYTRKKKSQCSCRFTLPYFKFQETRYKFPCRNPFTKSRELGQIIWVNSRYPSVT